MAKKTTNRPLILHPYIYSIEAVDKDGEWMELEGEVKAIDPQELLAELKWMVEHDYQAIPHRHTILQTDGASFISRDGTKVMFEDGPVPSYLEADYEGVDATDAFDAYVKETREPSLGASAFVPWNHGYPAKSAELLSTEELKESFEVTAAEGGKEDEFSSLIKGVK